MAAKTRRQYAGGAAQTSLVTSITSVATSASVASTTGWPSTPAVPFYVVIDPDTSVEEKCLATISGSTLTLTRGQDGTVASAHDAGATIYPVFTAVDADEANELASKFTAKGDIVTQGASTFETTSVGTNNQLLKADSSAAGGVAWATYSPVITLGGDLTGSVTLTNLGSGTLTATVAANSVALGTDTTGNYVSDVTAGTGITVTHTPGEGSSAAVAIDGTVATLTGSQTLTNKTIALGSNTVSGTKAQFDTAVTDDNFAYVGTANTFTTNQVISASSSSDLLRITQTGTGNALVVEDSTNPDSTPFVINNSGQVAVGHTAALGLDGGNIPLIAAYGSGATVVGAARYSADGGEARVVFAKSRNATVGSHTVVNNADPLGSIIGYGSDGTNYIPAAQIRLRSDGDPAANDMPGRIEFLTTADGASSVTERMRIDSAGLTTITGTAVITSNASTDALRITQTGAGNALVVEDSANPDSTPFVVFNDGKVAVGSTTNTGNAMLDIFSDASLGLNIRSAGAAGGRIMLQRNAGTIASPTAVAADNILGQLRGDGYDGTSYLQAANINLVVDGAVSTGTVPGRIIFSTGTAGTTTERMRIDSAGQVGIGVTPSAGRTLTVSKNVTGAVTSFSVLSSATVQSDVTTSARGIQSQLGTAAASFTVPTMYHFFATQDTFGAGSTVTTQAGYAVGSALTGATNNFGFYGALAAATGRWNLYMEGTADNYLAGSLGIGATPSAGYTLRVAKNITGATTGGSFVANGTVQSDVTTAYHSYQSFVSLAAASFTLATLNHFTAGQSTIGAGAAVTNQIGFRVDSNMTGATNNYGFRGLIASGSNRYNLFMDGTADNYLAGRLGVGATLTSGAMAQVVNTTAADIALIVRGAASQSGDLLSVQNSAATAIFTIGSGGQLRTNTSTDVSPLAGVTPDIQLSGTGNDASMGINRFSANADPSRLLFVKSRNATIGSHTVVADNDNIMTIQALASDGTSYIEAARITASVDGTPGTNDMPGRLVFATTADGGTTLTERMRITNAGNIGFNMSTFSGALVLAIGNGTAPTANPSNGGYLYVESGALKYRGSSGTVTTIANA